MTVKERYWRYSLVAITLVLGGIIYMESRPFLSGVLGAITIYLLVRKQMVYLTRKKRIKRVPAALLLLGEAVLCFLIPLGLVVWLCVHMVQSIDLDPSSLISSIEHISDLVKEKTGYNLLQAENLTSLVSYAPRIGQYIMGGISSFAINIFFLLFILYFMLIGAEPMERYVYEILPFNPKNKRVVLNEINLIVKSNAIGIPLLGIIQGVIAMIGYMLFGCPTPVLFGVLTAFATIIPIVGTALVWFPLMIYLALTGDWGNFIGLTLYSLLIVTNIDNFIRFLLQKKLADTHLIVTFFGVIIGITFFGFMGVIFGPLLLSGFLLCVNIFKNEYLDGRDAYLPPPRNTPPSGS
ncbi:MAG: AI-2E family transporter [Bacteroides sp.]|nr:AI-2E family transporter [Bacteroides sp.]